MDGIRNKYQEHGVKRFYQMFGDEYVNPHEPIIKELLREIIPTWNLDLSHVLDLACGIGEVTMTLRELGYSNVEAIDPYTYKGYYERTGQKAEDFTFEEITQGALEGREYSTIFCSFALHLAEKSILPNLCWRLAEISSNLVILTPHKRPEIKPEWGWKLEDEMMLRRVRARLYRKNF